MKSKADEHVIFELKSKKNDYIAYMEVIDGKYIVKRGSIVSKQISEHFKSHKVVSRRRQEVGVDGENRMLSSDIVFNSSSVAGEFVSGNSCNGPSSWRTHNGLSLKRWTENESKDS